MKEELQTMKRKLLAIALVCTMSVSLLIGCGSNGNAGNTDAENTGDTSATEDSSEATTDAQTGDVAQLTGIVLKHPLTQPNEDIEWLQEVEARTGVNITWEEISADWDMVKGPLLASGEIPDIIVGANTISDSDFAQFPGLFLDFAPHLDALPNVQRMFSEVPDTEILARQLSGEIYGLPKYQRFWPDTVVRQYINQEWLDNLGLDVPTNWDELFDVLVAFRDGDPVGNGNATEVIPFDFSPMPTSPSGFGFFSAIPPLLGSTGLPLTDHQSQGFFVEDGVVGNYWTDERFKDVVEFLHKAWAEGLMNPELFTQDYVTYQSVARGEGDDAKVGFSFGWEVADRFGDQLAPQYTSIAALEQSAGQSASVMWPYDSNTLNFATNIVTVSSQTSELDAALRFVNELYDPEVSVQILFGSIGSNIADNGDGTYAVLPPEEGSDMDQGTLKWTSTWADNGPMFIPDDFQLELGPDMAGVLEETVPLQPAIDNVNRETDVLSMMFIKFNDADNSTMARNQTNFMNVGLANFAEWVTNGGCENGWDAHVEAMNSAGLQENTEIIQRYYDEIHGN